ncbi:MAG UNVERIFIED_CONTAM: hypothetical protein LVR29_17180 [Microcystis novacekii LVE1205-3]
MRQHLPGRRLPGHAALTALLVGALLAAAAQPGLAAGERPGRGASALSGVSMVPVALSVAAPVGLLSGGVALTVVAVEAASEGTVWVLERASDGSRATVRFAERAAATASVALATTVVVTAVSTGWILSAGGRALCFVPNEAGRALLHHERVTFEPGVVAPGARPAAGAGPGVHGGRAGRAGLPGARTAAGGQHRAGAGPGRAHRAGPGGEPG